MHLPPPVRRRAAAALAATTLVVMASVGSCQMPQPKFPSLGDAGEAPRLAVASDEAVGGSSTALAAGSPWTHASARRHRYEESRPA
jgi:hypothetical protein